MTTMVCFRAAGAAYCIPVEATRSVCRTTGMIALPAPARDIVGIIPGVPPMTVISPLGGDGTHVLVVEAADKIFGLLVDEVTGLSRIADADIGPAPQGQERTLVSGTIETDGQLILVTDPSALAGRL